MPSLLRSLLSDHLDPGYAAAAAEREARGGRRPHDRWWQALAVLLIAAVFAAAISQARSTAPGLNEARQILAGSVRNAEDRTDQLTVRRDALLAESDAVERQELAADATGRALLGRLDALDISAATTAVRGPGLAVTLTEPGVGADLTDVSKQRLPGTRQVILDRDLQAAVNALWAAGAEAVAVGGVRIGPGATLRQAGGAILADNRPIASPYTIAAIGSPAELADGFGRSGALQRLRLLEAAYRVGVRVSTEEELTLPASAGREVAVAHEGGEGHR
ncbi:MAG TPA: DUF881 domain-containing protein [Mycobacterium sp.]|nr:MAG: DUF881 domain-containing protein [Mycobacterium sp.]HOB47801.1 DUF881 domain-containing protein [Mycobacterium sp.]HQE13741.1 DUF881 domain-containing protein [Mycobacterium sp.]